MGSQQRVAAITGAASGIGWALAQTFAEAGYIVCVIDLDVGVAQAKAGELSGQGEGAHAGFGCDVSNAEQVDLVFDAIAKQFGRLDVLVNNAGIAGSQEPSIEQDMVYFDRITKVIINGTFLCSRAAYHPMAAQRWRRHCQRGVRCRPRRSQTAQCVWCCQGRGALDDPINGLRMGAHGHPGQCSRTRLHCHPPGSQARRGRGGR